MTKFIMDSFGKVCFKSAWKEKKKKKKKKEEVVEERKGKGIFCEKSCDEFEVIGI